MKKYLFICIKAIIGICLFSACENNDAPQQDDYSTISLVKSKFENSNEFSSWKAMMEDRKSGELAKLYNQQNIQMVSFQYIGEVKITEAFFEDINGNAYMLAYGTNNDEINVIQNVLSYNEMDETQKKLYMSLRKYCLEDYIGETLGVVSVRWSVNNVVYESKAYVSQTFIAWDNFISTFRSITIGKKSKKSLGSRRFKVIEERKGNKCYYESDPFFQTDLNGKTATIICAFKTDLDARCVDNCSMANPGGSIYSCDVFIDARLLGNSIVVNCIPVFYWGTHAVEYQAGVYFAIGDCILGGLVTQSYDYLYTI